MKNRKLVIKILIIAALLSTSFLGFVLSRFDQGGVSSGNCGSGHGSESITISTNYTGNTLTIGQGETFDLEVTATGQVTGSVWIGYAFWHTGSDNIQIPDPTPFSTPGNTENEWNDGSDYYAMFAWQTVIDPMTRIFRITPSTLSSTETLTIQVGADSDLRSNVIAFSITVIAPDNQAPDVSITAPSDNSYVGGSSVSITATADDNGGSGVDTVWAEITNASYSETVYLSGSEPSYSASWDSTVVADGAYTLTLKANDFLSQLNDSEFITINVDNNAPGILIDSIVPNPSNGITTITVLNSSADIDGNGIRATISPPTGGDIHLDLIHQGTNIWNNTFTVTQTGSYLVSINATDLAGNTAVIGPTVVTGDITLPTVVITSPTEGQDVGGTVSITGIASGTGSKIVSLYINNTIWGDALQAPQIENAIGKFAGSFTFNNKSNIAPGFYWVEINITDSAGNFNSSVRFFNMTSEDITAPNIVLTATPDPSNGFTDITVVTNEALNNPPILNVTLPNSSVIFRPMFLTATNTWSTNYTVTSDGIHTIRVELTDTLLNKGTKSLNFTGDITPPTITLSVYPDPSNGLTTINAYNTTEIVTSIFANITTPSGFIHRELIYQGSNKWNTTFIVTENGIYTIIVNGTDLAGNVGYNSQSIDGDVVGPGINIVSITPNPSNGLTTITVSNSTSDIDGYGIRANVTTPSMTLLFVDLVYQGLNQWTGTFTVTEDGTYTIYVNATDILGDITHIGPFVINGDFTDPLITVNNPGIGDFGTNPPDFDLTILDYSIHSAWYIIFDGNEWSDITFFTGTSGTIDLSLWNSLSNGELIIRFFANDTFGNTGYADTSFIKEGQSQGDTPGGAILISEEDLMMIITTSIFMGIGALVIALLSSEKKRSMR